MPPDPDRRIVSKAEYRALMAEGEPQRARLRAPRRARSCSASNGTASYYAATPRKGMRFISLDTVAEGGGQ